MGELEPWMDEQYIRQLWFNLNEKVLVKVIRDKLTGASAGYAFVDFGSAVNAQRALNTFNGSLIPNTHKQFKLNWASGGGLIDRREDRQPEYSIFVGDLSPECTELNLLSAFQANYRSCKSAKIMTDPRTGLTRGYGFVRFIDQSDQQRALIEMQGFIIGSRPIRVSVATPKNRLHNTTNNQPQTTTSSTSVTPAAIASPTLRSPLQQSMVVNPQQPQQQQATSPSLASTLLSDPSNTTVFVGGLSAPIREDELRQYFSPFGEIMQVKIPPGKGCGFVQYAMRHSAELAIHQMNGYQIGNSRIRLSWGRSQNDNNNNNNMTTANTTITTAKQQQPSIVQQLHHPSIMSHPSLPPPSSHPPAAAAAAAASMVAALSRSSTSMTRSSIQQQQQQQQTSTDYPLIGNYNGFYQSSLTQQPKYSFADLSLMSQALPSVAAIQQQQQKQHHQQQQIQQQSFSRLEGFAPTPTTSNDSLDLIPEDALFPRTGSLLDKKSTNATWRFNQVYAQ
ncbi:hypothetical protein INT45_012829 [Circinella minor]|uniref:RRM domain-containing protein n=1 Tax=Circinella minor TaxID=1195481 RepID=A0A8H7VJ64_9FUNG|nr:hypothetical protein INT45_012829 [Circinella minor]